MTETTLFATVDVLVTLDQDTRGPDGRFVTQTHRVAVAVADTDDPTLAAAQLAAAVLPDGGMVLGTTVVDLRL